MEDDFVAPPKEVVYENSYITGPEGYGAVRGTCNARSEMFDRRKIVVFLTLPGAEGIPPPISLHRAKNSTEAGCRR